MIQSIRKPFLIIIVIAASILIPVLSFAQAPDIQVQFMNCPRIASAGDGITASLKIRIFNNGNADASNIMVDILLSTDRKPCSGAAVYSASWSEDVLLKGGREHILLLKAGESRMVELNGTNVIPADTPTGNYYLIVNTDPVNTIAESNERNNYDYCRLKIRGKDIPGTGEAASAAKLKPDLKIEKLYVTPVGAAAGTKIDLHCDFRNIGDNLTGNWNLGYYIDGKEVYSQKWADIPAGAYRNPSGWWIANTPGSHTFTCKADKDNDISEIRENNNKKSIRFEVTGVAASRKKTGDDERLPDLVPVRLRVDPDMKVGEWPLLHCDFRNIGGTFTGSWNLAYYVDGIETFKHRWGNITPGIVAESRGTWKVNRTGWHTCTCKLDVDSEITEHKENNNEITIRFEVKPEKPQADTVKPVPKNKPDLIISLKADSVLVPGTEINNLVVKVKNFGDSVAYGTDTHGTSGYMVDIVLSTDSNLPFKWAVYSAGYNDDMLLQGGRMSNTPDLNPGETKTWTLNNFIKVPADVPVRSFCLGAVVDAGKVIDESNENNNTYCQMVKVGK